MAMTPHTGAPATSRTRRLARSAGTWGILLASVLTTGGCGAVAGRNPLLADLVEVGPNIPGIVVELRFAGKSNFLKQKVYDSARCMLRRATVGKLRRAQRVLERHGLGLKVWDAYRPLSVQRRMWSLKPDARYVDDPGGEARRCRGCVVDLTLVDAAGDELPMSTAADPFDPLDQPLRPDLPPQLRANRALLEAVLTASGFVPSVSHWYRFDDADWARYPVLDISPGARPVFASSKPLSSGRPALPTSRALPATPPSAPPP